MEYWRTIWSESWQRTKVGLASRERRITSILLPIIVFVIAASVLLILGQAIPVTLIVGVVSALLGYGVVVLVEFFRHLLKIPPERDAEQRAKIESLRAASKSPPPPDPISVTVLGGEWGAPRGSQPSQNIVQAGFSIKIRNGGAPTTLDDWFLRSTSRANLIGRLVEFNLSSPNAAQVSDVRLAPLPQGGATAGSVVFHITGLSLTDARDPRLGWFIEFSDASGKLHKVEIPQKYYSPYR